MPLYKMVNLTSVPVTASKTIFTIRNMFFYSFVFITMFIILFSALQESIKTRTITPLLSELGRTFLLANLNLAQSSQEIIDNQQLLPSSTNFLSDSWNIITKFSGFFVSFFVIYLWLKLLMFLFSHSFISNRDNFFTNFFLACAAYYILEVLFVLTYAAIAHKINSITDLTPIIMLPISSCWLFLKALYILLSNIAKPLSERLNHANNSVINAGLINKTDSPIYLT